MGNQSAQVSIEIAAQILAASSMDVSVDDVRDAVWMLDIAQFDSELVDLDADDLDISFAAQWSSTSIESPEDYENEDFQTWQEAQTDIQYWAGVLRFTLEFEVELPEPTNPQEFLKDLNIEWYPLTSDNDEVFVLESQSEVVSEKFK